MNTMTFNELNTKLGGNEKKSDWHQHKNGGGWVHKSATVDSTAFIGPAAIAWGQASGNARVSGDARVYGDATVSGNAWEQSPLFIIGSKHSLSNAKYGFIQIGCRCETFKWWTSKEAEAFAKSSGYTPTQIKEYREYIKLFTKIGK